MKGGYSWIVLAILLAGGIAATTLQEQEPDCDLLRDVYLAARQDYIAVRIVELLTTEAPGPVDPTNGISDSMTWDEVNRKANERVGLAYVMLCRDDVDFIAPPGADTDDLPLPPLSPFF